MERIAVINAPAARLLQLTPVQAVGKKVNVVVNEEAILRVADDVKGATAPITRELRLIRAGQHVTYHAVAAGTKAGGVLLVLRNVSAMAAAVQMKTDFVANASHELRTPLASLIGFIDTLRGPAADDPPAQRRFLAIMAEQAERMNRLIDDLLSLSRIELTEHQRPAGRVDLGELCHRVAASFEPRLASRHIALEVSIEPALPKLTADGDQLAQVVTNLVDNAVKYGRESGTVKLRLGSAPPGGRWPAPPGVVLSVADDGAGIPRAHVARLTERFYRADKGRSRAAGGTGLGLAIVKHIVNRHRGQLLIESEEGRGSTFSVWLPLTVEGA
jgi:two-component system phosphate regulon sensor histidine kinase PhoR